MSDRITRELAEGAAVELNKTKSGQDFIRYVIEEICGYGQTMFSSDMHKTLNRAVRTDVANEILDLLK